MPEEQDSTASDQIHRLRELLEETLAEKQTLQTKLDEITPELEELRKLTHQQQTRLDLLRKGRDRRIKDLWVLESKVQGARLGRHRRDAEIESLRAELNKVEKKLAERDAKIERFRVGRTRRIARISELKKQVRALGGNPDKPADQTPKQSA